MALKLSTGLRNYLLGEGSLRKAFEDGLIKIYSGSAPATADAAVTGTLLATITKASGAVAASARSTPGRVKIVIGSHASGETFKFNVTVDGVGPTIYTYTNTPDAGDADAVAKGIARMFNDIPQLDAIAEGANGDLYVKSRIDGLTITITNEGSGTGTISSVAEVEAASAINTLKLGAPASGAIEKNSDVWSGAAGAGGTAGYFRLVQSSDDGTESTTQVRLQGSISTSGADLNLSNINIASGATQTIDSFEITLPAA